MKKYFILWCIIYLSACSSQYGRYQQKHDSKPTRAPFPSELRDAIPKHEPYKKANGRPYTVRGKHYTVLKTAKEFNQTGIASWYGNKFHGHLTANGEIYNMYSMSAAHKNLPLPTYLNVTNLANNKSVIVRVNDRGPFHENRIIDLSYSAAYKLDMLKTGTAQVKITAITNFNPPTSNPITVTKTPVPINTPAITTVNELPNHEKESSIIAPHKNNSLPHTFIQVLSTQNKILAEKTAKALTILHQKPSKTVMHGKLHRVLLGPFKSNTEINTLLNLLKDSGYPTAFKKLMMKS